MKWFEDLLIGHNSLYLMNTVVDIAGFVECSVGNYSVGHFVDYRSYSAGNSADNHCYSADFVVD